MIEPRNERGVCEMANSAVTYVGQVEQDPQGTLWAVLYYRTKSSLASRCDRSAKPSAE